MILIISRDYDRSTFDVVEWLLYFKEDFTNLTNTKSKLTGNDKSF
jgi:hypothetical protein